MTDNDRILWQVLEQQLSLRLREGCRDVLLHLLPGPLRGLLYIVLRSSAAGYARMWVGTRTAEGHRIAGSGRPARLQDQGTTGVRQSRHLIRDGTRAKRQEGPFWGSMGRSRQYRANIGGAETPYPSSCAGARLGAGATGSSMEAHRSRS